MEEVPLYLGIPMVAAFIALTFFLIMVALVIWRDR